MEDQERSQLDALRTGQPNAQTIATLRDNPVNFYERKGDGGEDSQGESVEA